MRKGRAILFMGAGASSQTAEFPVSLARSLQDGLGISGTGTRQLRLDEIADIYDARGMRQEMFDHIRRRLEEAPYPQSLKELTRFPWRAIFTTNYDTFIERAFHEAGEEGLTAYQCQPIYSDKEIGKNLSATQVPLIKLHGCITRSADEMVISGVDYQRNYLLNREFLLRWLAVESIRSNLLFVGYSLQDKVIADLLAHLREQLGINSVASFVVRPENELEDDHERLLHLKFDLRSLPGSLDIFSQRIREFSRRPVVMFSGSTRRLASDQQKRVAALGRALAPQLASEGIRALSGGTSSDKFGWIVAEEVKQLDDALSATYLWTHVEAVRDPNVDDAVDKAPNYEYRGVSADDVIDLLVTEAQVAVFAGGAGLTLPEYQLATVRGLLIIPVKLGDEQYVSDVIHTYMSATHELVREFDADRGYREKRRRTDWSAKLLDKDRLDRLDLSKHEPEAVANTIMEILRAYRWLALARS